MACEIQQAIDIVKAQGSALAVKRMNNIIEEYADVVLGSENLGGTNIENERAYFERKQTIQDLYNEIKTYEGSTNTYRINEKDYRINKVSMEGQRVIVETNNAGILRLGSEDLNYTESFTLDPRELQKDALKSVEGIIKLLDNLDDNNVDAGYKKYVIGLLQKIDPKFIPNLNVYISKEAQANRGMISSKDLVINVSDKELIKTNEMTSTEVYAHEIMHAITKFALNNATSPEAKILINRLENLRDLAEEHVTVEDLMPAQSLDKAKDRKMAETRLKYIFESKNSLHEFIAHGLTNPAFMQKLKNIKVKEVNKSPNLFETIVDFIEKLFDVVLGKIKWSDVNKSVKKSLEQLSFELMLYNNEAANNVKEEPSVIANLLDLSNDKISKLIDEGIEALKGDAPPRLPANATKVENLIYMSKLLPKLLLREDLRGTRESILSSLGMKPEGFFQNVLRDFENPTELERTIEELGMAADNLDRIRENTVTEVKNMILDKFERQLTKTEEEAVTLSLIDVDLGSIYKQYGPTQMKKLLTDPEALQAQIKKVTTQLKKLDEQNFNWNNAQSTGLGFYLATHIAGPIQNLNANNIASGVLSGKRRFANKDVVAKIDELSTLIGMNYTPNDSNKLLADLIQENKDGVQYLVDLNEGAKKTARAELFSTDVNVIKGYSKELFDSTVDVRIKPIADHQKMIGQGFELVKTLVQSEGDTNTKEMGLYRSKTYVNNSYNRAATRTTNIAKRGTSLTDIRYSTDELLARRTAARDIRRIKASTQVLVEQMEKGEYKLDTESNLSPVLNQDGNITDYRYMMGKENKKSLLEQDTQVSEVLGRTIASIGDKIDTDQQNAAVLDVILADMKENYLDGNIVGRNGKEYIKIERNSPNANVREIYNLLPHHMKQAIRDSNVGHIAVRRDMLHNYFGFRDASFTDFLGLYKITPDIIKRWIKLAERLWSQIVSISKVDIVIRMPSVFLGNVISNFMYSVVMGANPITVGKMQLANTKEVIKYVDKQHEITRLKVGKMIGQDTKNKIARIEYELSKSPVHDLMEAGMYQAIIEDITKQDFKSSNRLVRGANEAIENMPEWVKTGANWMYLDEKTKYFQIMTKATQYSDFIARATEYQLLRKKGVDKKEALQTVLDAFVNYGKPASAFEEYLNNMGLFMFTKYMKRIQRAIGHTAKSKPINVLLSVLGQEMFFDVSDIQEQSVLTRSSFNLVDDLSDHIKRAFTPTSLQFIGVAD